MSFPSPFTTAGTSCTSLLDPYVFPSQLYSLAYVPQTWHKCLTWFSPASLPTFSPHYCSYGAFTYTYLTPNCTSVPKSFGVAPPHNLSYTSSSALIFFSKLSYTSRELLVVAYVKIRVHFLFVFVVCVKFFPAANPSVRMRHCTLSPCPPLSAQRCHPLYFQPTSISSVLSYFLFPAPLQSLDCVYECTVQDYCCDRPTPACVHVCMNA